jgi:hypothetical protein
MRNFERFGGSRMGFDCIKLFVKSACLALTLLAAIWALQVQMFLWSSANEGQFEFNLLAASNIADTLIRPFFICGVALVALQLLATLSTRMKTAIAYVTWLIAFYFQLGRELIQNAVWEYQDSNSTIEFLKNGKAYLIFRDLGLFALQAAVFIFFFYRFLNGSSIKASRKIPTEQKLCDRKQV